MKNKYARMACLNKKYYFFADGYYHISVTALNKVEFGGPMAVRVCHSTPYIIDTTDPVIVNITQAVYDQLKQAITLQVGAQ